jgi:CDP-2,3-bis-(O-geranylgeranyl)-sn-glycerol synthase
VNYLSDIQLLILLAAANGAPVFAKWLFGNRCAFPLDGNIKLGDGRPLFGASKTIRGILASIAVASVLAALLSMSVGIGFLVGSTAMAGDLCSSFTKRRLGLTPSSKATGLDQIPESLFPLLASRQALSLTLIDITAVTAIFFVGEIFLSKLLFRFKLRDRPY